MIIIDDAEASVCTLKSISKIDYVTRSRNGMGDAQNSKVLVT